MTHAKRRSPLLPLTLIAALHAPGCIVVHTGNQPSTAQKAEAAKKATKPPPETKKPEPAKPHVDKPAHPKPHVDKPAQTTPPATPTSTPTHVATSPTPVAQPAEQPTQQGATQGAGSAPTPAQPAAPTGGHAGEAAKPAGSAPAAQNVDAKAPIIVPAPPVTKFVPPAPKPVGTAPSRIVVPVMVPLAELAKRLDALIPKTAEEGWTKATKGGETPEVDVKYQVWREPIQLALHGSEVEITVPLLFASNFRAKVKNPLGGSIWITKDETWGTTKEPQHVTATIHTKLDVDGSWKLRTSSKLEPLVHGAPPSGKICANAVLKACIHKADVAPMVKKRMDAALVPKIEQALAGADKQVEGAFALKKHASAAWASLQEPKSLAQPGQPSCPTELGAACKEPVWLVVSPTRVAMGPLHQDHDYAALDVAMLGTIAVVVGDAPKVKPTPLPALQTTTGSPGVHVRATLQLPMAALGTSLAHKLAGVSLVAKGQSLAVRGVKLMSNADAKTPHRVAMQLSLAGSIAAEIYVVGDLLYDAAAQTIAVSNLDYTVETKNEFVAQLAAANHDAFKKELAGKARLELASLAGPLEQAIGRSIHPALGAGFDVAGNLAKVAVQDITVKPELVAVDVTLEGSFKGVVKH